MKVEIRYATIAGLIFGTVLTIFFDFRFEWKVAVVIGSTAGFTFGIFTFLFLKSKKMRRKLESRYFRDQKVIYSGEAIYFCSGLTIGGNLYLLNKKLQFQPHRYTPETENKKCISLNSISKIVYFNFLGFIPTGVLITVDNGEQKRFLLYNRKHWKELILDAQSLSA